MKTRHISSGELAISDNSPTMMHTVVGVCVAVCLWDRVSKRGGLCHYRLPELCFRASNQYLHINDAHDFGAEAIVALLRLFKQRGSAPTDLEARVVGGANIHVGEYMKEQAIGERNIAIAMSTLAQFQITVVATVVGGNCGRQIRFDPATGELDFRELPITDSSPHPETTGALIADSIPSLPSVQQAPVASSAAQTRLGRQVERQVERQAEPRIQTLLIDNSNTDRQRQKLSTATYTGVLGLDRECCDSSLIVLGASTGGVEALEVVLKQLPELTPPICIVQHIPKGFSYSLANKLNKVCAVEVSEAVDGDEIENSHVYFAQGGKHLKIVQLDCGKLILRVTDEPAINSFKPSVDYLFDSVQKIANRKKVAVLLTGMGRDGAAGLLALKNQGAHTLAQNEASSVVWGMARVAEDLGAVCRTTTLNDIATAMLQGAKNSSSKQHALLN